MGGVASWLALCVALSFVLCVRQHARAQLVDTNDLPTQLLELENKISAKVAKKIELDEYANFLERSLRTKQNSAVVQQSSRSLDAAELKRLSLELENVKNTTLQALTMQIQDLEQTQVQLRDDLQNMIVKRQHLLIEDHELRHQLKENGIDYYVSHSFANYSPTIQGTVKRSAEAIFPFFELISVMAQTNERMVKNVAHEIDRMIHVQVTHSPFLLGLLFYALMLVPGLTVASIMFRVYDNVISFTVSHYLLFTSIYFVGLSIVSFIFCQISF